MAKKKKAPEGHGGSWKVALADFMTSMFALFLLLWLINLTPKQKAGIETYFKTYSIFKHLGSIFQGRPYVIPLPSNTGKSEEKPEGIKKYPPKLDVDIKKKLMDELKEQIKKHLKTAEDQVIIEEFKDGIRIQLIDKEGKPMFELGSNEPTERGREALKIIAGKIKSRKFKMALEGHTDAKQYASSAFTNWELSTMRASASRRILEENGVDPSTVVSVSGFAETRPFIKENPLDPKNRRISILLNVKQEDSSFNPDF